MSGVSSMKGICKNLQEHDDITKHAIDAVEWHLAKLIVNNAAATEGGDGSDSDTEMAKDGDDNGG
eukprot:10686186-Ditylum_brightwellii.AAC.1